MEHNPEEEDRFAPEWQQTLLLTPYQTANVRHLWGEKHHPNPMEKGFSRDPVGELHDEKADSVNYANWALKHPFYSQFSDLILDMQKDDVRGLWVCKFMLRQQHFSS